MTRPPGSQRGRGSRGLRPNKRLGQHFLADAWARKIVDRLAPQPEDVFLEIGPGTGALTMPLAATGAPILAVEVDRRLAHDLAARVPPNVTVVTDDILRADVTAYLSGLQPQRPPGLEAVAASRPRYRVVGNLPYNISSPILFRLLEWHLTRGLFSDATVMLQREVADRLLARPGTKAYGVLTIMLAVHTSVVRLFDLPPGAFRPPPQVRSSVVQFTFGPPAIRVPDPALFERMVKALFAQRRKTLGNALKAFEPTAPAVLSLAAIDARRRPETLQLAELARLAELIASVRRPAVL